MTSRVILAPLVDLILVERLRRVYWPQEIFEMYRLERVLRAKPVEHFIPEDNVKCRNALYDLGRVHYFYRRLHGGGCVDPISLETEVPFGRLGSPVDWGSPIITDGHHRFAAAVLARKRRIPATFGGVVEQLEWLTGARPFRSLPVGVESLGA